MHACMLIAAQGLNRLVKQRNEEGVEGQRPRANLQRGIKPLQGGGRYSGAARALPHV